MSRLVTLTGNTFAAKDEIKKLGGKWDQAKKAWVVDANRTMKEKAVLDAALFQFRKQGIVITY